MDTREIQKLIDFISKSDLSEVNIETSELKLQIKRNGGSPVQYVSAPVIESVVNHSHENTPAPVRELAAPTAPVEASSHLVEIKAPMIGTFYDLLAQENQTLWRLATK